MIRNVVYEQCQNDEAIGTAPKEQEAWIMGTCSEIERFCEKR